MLRRVEENPYEAPAVVDVEAPAATDPEAVRLKHLGHETSLKSLGLICYIIGFLGCFSVAMTYFVAWYSGSELPRIAYDLPQVAVWILPIPFQFVVGYGLRRLLPWVRMPAGLLFAISLVRLPIGPLIGVWGLYLVLSAKGRIVLSPAYREIVAATQHLRYRRSSTARVLLWAGFIVLALLILLAFFG